MLPVRIVVDLFVMLFRNSSYFLSKAFDVTSARLVGNPDIVRKIVLSSGSVFFDELDKYPSAFNDGYRHIAKAVELTRYLKLPDNSIIVDVGAASGVISRRFANAFPEALIYAFEPIPDTFKLLTDNVKDEPRIKTINKGLGDEAGTSNIHIAARVTSSSLLGINNDLPGEFWKSNLAEQGIVPVVVSKLDLEIPTGRMISIMKIDVQGFELEVLKGGIDTLKRTAIVVVEMQNHDLYKGAPPYYEIDAFLRQHNFQLYNMIPSIRQDQKLYEWDALYVNKSIVSS